MRNLTKKYNGEENNIVFAYSDIAKNQPRDLNIEEGISPIILLYTNALNEKKIIRMHHLNFTEITQQEVEDFLYEQLNSDKNSKNEYKIKDEKFKSQKNKDKNKNEKKEKDTQTDL